MNETVREWIAKAEGDYWTANRELHASEWLNYDAVCFHSQQCIEKLMKAVLIHRSTVPPRIHDLAQLDRVLASSVPDWSWPVEELRFLTRAAVGYRYPGEMADQEEATQALDICVRLRERLLALLEGPE
jgi:HEPN domain-containing protein